MENIDSTTKKQAKEKEIQWKIYRNTRQEEETCRLKSWQLWIQAGDKNTTFFHNSAKKRMIKNKIEKIVGEGGQEIKGQEDVKREVFWHFKALLIAVDNQANPKEFLMHIPKLIDEETKNILLDLRLL